MRASRLVRMLARLQVGGGTTAPALAEELGVTERTVLRDVAALRDAGVPVITTVGRNGGISLDPDHRMAGLPRMEPDDARGVLLAAVPSIARQLGLPTDVAETSLLPAMDAATETTARAARDRLLVDPTRSSDEPPTTPALVEVARAVWDARELRCTYRGEVVLVQPLGLVLKGDTWYALVVARRRADGPTRLLRVSRMAEVRVLRQRFVRPDEFDLVEAWERHRDAFQERVAPTHEVLVRVAPRSEWMLGRLDEARVPLPLPDDVERDREGWALLRLLFERPGRAARVLLRLGADVEVLAPDAVRAELAATAARIAALHASPR